MIAYLVVAFCFGVVMGTVSVEPKKEAHRPCLDLPDVASHP